MINKALKYFCIIGAVCVTCLEAHALLQLFGYIS